jgi:hypothetical protein
MICEGLAEAVAAEAPEWRSPPPEIPMVPLWSFELRALAAAIAITVAALCAGGAFLPQ